MILSIEHYLNIIKILSTPTRTGRKTTNEFNTFNNDIFTADTNYYNPYEYGSKQNILPSLTKTNYNGPYMNNNEYLNNMNINVCNETYPLGIRNVTIESALIQQEMTHIPGQKD